MSTISGTTHDIIYTCYSQDEVVIRQQLKHLLVIRAAKHHHLQLFKLPGTKEEITALGFSSYNRPDTWVMVADKGLRGYTTSVDHICHAAADWMAGLLFCESMHITQAKELRQKEMTAKLAAATAKASKIVRAKLLDKTPYMLIQRVHQTSPTTTHVSTFVTNDTYYIEEHAVKTYGYKLLACAKTEEQLNELLEFTREPQQIIAVT